MNIVLVKTIFKNIKKMKKSTICFEFWQTHLNALLKGNALNALFSKNKRTLQLGL